MGTTQPNHGQLNHELNQAKEQNHEPKDEKVQELPTPDTKKGPAIRATSTIVSNAARITLTLTIKPPKIGGEFTIKTKRIK